MPEQFLSSLLSTYFVMPVVSSALTIHVFMTLERF
jgi:hypothetical protein